MAEYSPTISTNPPAPTMTTELWYSENGTNGGKQVFGVQGVPSVQGTADDITFRTLESTEEFGMPGVKAFTAIEVELLLYKDQYTALVAIDNTEQWWFIKYPESIGLIMKWQGRCSFTLSDISLDDMCKCKLKIYKSTIPEKVASLPTGT